MKTLIFSVVLAFCVQLTAAQAPSATATPVPLPEWSPPVARTNAKTPFAPKPTTGNNIFKGESEAWLADAIVSVEGPYLDPISDREVSDYISKLGAYLATYSAAPGRPYKFVVTRSEEENAFSIGNGRIYIDLGMLRSVESEDELASVIAHEIGHDAFGHCPKTVTRQLFWMTGITKVNSAKEIADDLAKLNAAYEKNAFAMVGEAMLGWSRSDELQADKAGFYNIYKAGYNPESMKNVFRHYVAEEKKGGDYSGNYMLTLLFGSHPPSSQRVTALKWESLWVKMPAKEDHFESAPFKAMKLRIAKL